MGYARAGTVDIAYQVYGDGDVPVVAIPGAASCVELIWEYPPNGPWLERWGSIATMAHFDKRGTGQSDRVIGAPSVEERIEDVTAVMDAAGFESAAIYGISEGGGLAALFAATYPERTRALVLQNTFAHIARPELIDETARIWSEHWGTPETATAWLCAQSQLGKPGFIDYINRWERAAATRGTLRAILELVKDIDVRPAAAAIQCPTLVLHATRDPLVPAVLGEEFASLIPGARFLAYDSPDHYPSWVGLDEQLDAVEELLTGQITGGPVDRVLATVLFTDIVGSTERAATEGDTRWRTLLEEQDRTARREVEKHRGRFVKGTGDGMLATFDSPARAIRCARACSDAVRPLGLELRSGLHTGEIELLRDDDVAGIAVHLAARVSSLAGPGEVLVSGAVPPLVVGSGMEFADRGRHELKGVPGEWQVLAVV